MLIKLQANIQTKNQGRRNSNAFLPSLLALDERSSCHGGCPKLDLLPLPCCYHRGCLHTFAGITHGMQRAAPDCPVARSAERTVVLLLPQPNASLEHRLRQDYSLHNLIIQPNPEGVDAPWMSSFAHATMRSGVSKGAFITWLASQKRFTRAWHIEEDVLFTGRWHELFDAYVTSPADLVANIHKIHPGWAYEHSCKVRADLPCYPHGVQTPGVDGLVTSWPAMRLSAALAQQLCSSLCSTTVQQGTTKRCQARSARGSNGASCSGCQRNMFRNM